MQRSIGFQLNKVSPTPSSLRLKPSVDAPGTETTINLAQLFHHYWLDSYGVSAPKPDPSRFEYVSLVSASNDFRFQRWLAGASTVKRRAISTELGQAFCRAILHDHFGVNYFAHMNDVLARPTHAAFEGMKVERIASGDVPDYLCARKSTEPLIAESKGRHTSISFASEEFGEWRRQFSRIRVTDRNGMGRRAKGYVVATRFVTDGNAPRTKSKVFIEDPETEGREPIGDHSPFLARAALAMHFGNVFRKLGVLPIAAALEEGFVLAPELQLQVPVWVCITPPLQGHRFVGGYYRTSGGKLPSLSRHGWRIPDELGAGHAVFAGLELRTALTAAAACRGDWARLDGVPVLEPTGAWSSDFSWLRDGTVLAPSVFFLPIGAELL